MIPTGKNYTDAIIDKIHDIINMLQQIGFIVNIILSDANKLNQNIMKKLTDGGKPGISFPNPLHSELEIFWKFDPVHMFKGCRNNMIRIADKKMSLKVPGYEDFVLGGVPRDLIPLEYPDFRHLREIYQLEKNMIVKDAYRLTEKSMFPGPFDKQNVRHVDSVYHDSTLAKLSSTESHVETYRHMAREKKLFDILSVKNYTLGHRKRKDDSKPFLKTTYRDDVRLKWLTNYAAFVDNWHKDPRTEGGRYSNDLRLVITQVCKVTPLILEQLFEKFEVDSVLTGKQQTDGLERYFGKLRQIFGGQYKLSMVQMEEGMKKMRIRRLAGDFLRDGYVSFNEPDENDEPLEIDETECEVLKKSLEELQLTLDADYKRHVVNFPKSAIEYITGAATRSTLRRFNVLRSCNKCMDLFVASIGEKTDDLYFNNIQRGGLIDPGKFPLTVSTEMLCILHEIHSEENLS